MKKTTFIFLLLNSLFTQDRLNSTNYQSLPLTNDNVNSIGSDETYETDMDYEESEENNHPEYYNITPVEEKKPTINSNQSTKKSSKKLLTTLLLKTATIAVCTYGCSKLIQSLRRQALNQPHATTRETEKISPLADVSQVKVEDTCSICLEGVSGLRLAETPIFKPASCNGYICKPCLDQIMQNTSLCPFCRKTLILETRA